MLGRYRRAMRHGAGLWWRIPAIIIAVLAAAWAIHILVLMFMWAAYDPPYPTGEELHRSAPGAGPGAAGSP